MKSVWRLSQSLLASALLLILLVCQFSFYYYTHLERLSEAHGDIEVLGVSTKTAGNTLIYDVSFRLDYLIKLKSRTTIVTVPLGMPLVNLGKTFYIYFDERYPSSGLGLREWIGLRDHIPLELKKIGFECKIIDADQLRNVIQGEADVPIVIPSGVLPSTVYSRDGGLVSNWLMKGGLLIWIGNAFGYFIGHEDGTLEFVGSAGQRDMLGYDLEIGSLPYWEAIADNWTDFARGLALSYPHAWVGPNLEALARHGGLALGGIFRSRVGERYSSISLLQSSRGSGRMIVFGGGVGYAGAILGEDFIARDIAKILWSGMPFSQIRSSGPMDKESSSIYPSIGYISYQLEGQGTIRDTLSMTVINPSSEKQVLLEVTLLAFTSNPYTELYVKNATSISVSHGSKS